MVTMKWWNDLWLNESFATVVAYIACAIGDDKALDDVKTYAWLYFGEEKRWALADDLKPTTHSIEAPCPSTEVAEGLIDGITYGKGAYFLRQLIHLIGTENFFIGCQKYF
jgi:aminopeptidase N